MGELKPCPFCGSARVNVIEHKFHHLSDSFGVKCFNCKIESYQFFDSRKEAIEAWNRRVMNDPIDRQAVLRALKDAFDKYEDKVDIEVELIASVLKIPSANLQPNLQPTCNQLATDCISREAAIDALRYAQHRFTVADEAGGMGTVKWREDVIYFAAAERILTELPSAQPYDYSDGYADGYKQGQKDAQQERKKGKWKYVGYMVVECPECNAQLHELEYTNFCPNCGAKMEEGEEDGYRYP